MKDIDFDELDRAVSSILETPAEQAPTAEVAPGDTPIVVPVPKKEDVPAASPDAAPADTAEASDPVSSAGKVPIATRRRGQFMDVVHPSSDMTSKPSDAPTSPAAPKMVLKPISASVVPDEPSSDAEPVVEPSAEVEVPSTVDEAPTEAADSPLVDHPWPDPLDVMENQEDAKDAKATPVEAIEDMATEEASVDEISEPDTADEPVSSTPFLADTKVDKRPLDAFSPDDVPADAVAPDPGLGEMTAEALPPELQSDIVAVESGASDSVSDTEETPETKEETGKSKKTEEKVDEPTFNASIPQQYAVAEAQASDDHSIFDTSEYHQPLAPAKSKKRGVPGWLTALLVIIVLIGAGAAGGYFWFQYGF